MKQLMFFLSIVVGLSGCVSLPENTSGRVVVGNKNAHVDVRFNDRDRHLIYDHFRKHGKKKKNKRVPPGLAKRGGHLPPGLAKRDRLPPGLQGRGLSHALESRLSYLPDSYVRLKVGTDIVLMNRKTRVVFDIIRGVD